MHARAHTHTHTQTHTHTLARAPTRIHGDFLKAGLNIACRFMWTKRLGTIRLFGLMGCF